MHLGWSGNQTTYAERLHNGARLLGSGELLEQGEVQLGTGESLTTPWTYAAHGTGVDEVAARFGRDGLEEVFLHLASQRQASEHTEGLRP